MTTTYPLPTLAATITSSGITAPPYTDIYASLQASFQSIYGTDAYIAPDSQDGQLLAIFAKAVSDCNQTAINVYNSFSPATSQSANLSNNVKLNGISRLVASRSQANVLIVGTVGTTITSGVVQDVNGNKWDLPASVVIPFAGQILVAATCQVYGAITADIGQINQINTPTLGWQSVTNPASASTGNQVETDAALRARQAQSVALPSLTVLAGIVGGIQTLTGVQQVVAYENDTGTTDSNGVPGHSISLVVLGGTASDIANVIMEKKTPGSGTYGTTTVGVTDSVGVVHNINFFIPSSTRIVVAITLHPLTSGYTSLVATSIRQAVVDFINALQIGDDVERSRLYLPAQLFGAPGSLTYNVTNLLLAAYPTTPGTSDVVIAFNARATCQLSDVTITVV